MLIKVEEFLAPHVTVYIENFIGIYEIYIDYEVYHRDKCFIRFKNSKLVTNCDIDQGIPPSDFKKLLREGILRFVFK